jgi:hypothetical protein
MSDLIKANPEFGSHILKHAESNESKRRTELVLAVVQKIMHDHQNAVDWAEENKRAASFHKAQLNAIEAGTFTLTSDAYGTRLLFADARLNKYWQDIRMEWTGPEDAEIPRKD